MTRISNPRSAGTVLALGRSMLKVTGRPTPWLAAAWGLALALFACEPTPVYPTPEQPVVGEIYAEMSTIATGADQQINLLYDRYSSPISVFVPSGAYPAGTRVTIRLVSDLRIQVDTEIALVSFLEGDNFDALQLLPAKQAPAVPLHVDLTGKGHPWAFSLLHARENASIWTDMGKLNASATTLSFDITESGLWTVGQLPLPPSLQGRLSQDVTTSRPRLLDIVGVSYALASPTSSGCYTVETGTIHSWVSTVVELKQSSAWNWVDLDYKLDPSGTGITFSLYSDGCPTISCPEAPIGHYVVSQPGSPGPLPAQPDGGCPVNAGGLPDAGRD
jgi:hypothetical protein